MNFEALFKISEKWAKDTETCTHEDIEGHGNIEKIVVCWSRDIVEAEIVLINSTSKRDRLELV